MKTNTLQQLSLLGLSAIALATTSLDAQAQTTPNPIEETTEVSSQEIQKTNAPVPGTVTTSAAGLEFQSAASSPNPVPQANEAPTDESEVAQGPFGVARPTRSGASYIGIGYNIGLGGDTGLGDAAFAINGKIGLSNTLSVRPAAILGDDTAFLIPVTYDFNIRSRRGTFDEPINFAPYAGGGLVFSTDDDEDIGFLLTGGIDVPVSEAFTANAGINVGFMEDDTDIGLLLGIGYTFPNF